MVTLFFKMVSHNIIGKRRRKIVEKENSLWNNVYSDVNKHIQHKYDEDNRSTGNP